MRRNVFVIALLIASIPAAAQTEGILYNFGPLRTDPYYPAGLIFDATGNLYGTSQGGAHGNGTVFELMPQAGGGWSEKVLYSFCSLPHCADGGGPIGPLVFDAAGNLYGTTNRGGAYNSDDGGLGTVFELSPSTDGTWTESVIHSFGNGTDGAIPSAGVIFDAAGNLYGTTNSEIYNGPYGYGLYSSGTAFELSPQAGGVWTETLLHTWDDDGQTIYAGLVFDTAGNLYGSTYSGGGGAPLGTVFELSPSPGGKWAEKTISGSGGSSTLIFDTAGNLYGVVPSGGAYRRGVAFELSPKTGGGWEAKALYNFGGIGHAMDGYGPDSALTFDAAGNLYGTTVSGGEGGQACYAGQGIDGCGVLFELTPATGGIWTETVVHYFGHGKDARNPFGALIKDASGNLHGTAGGGAYGLGTVFEFKP